MKWIKYTEEKPIEEDFYFVYGKRGKALLEYRNGEWDLGYLAQNHFSDDNIYWLFEPEIQED